MNTHRSRRFVRQVFGRRVGRPVAHQRRRLSRSLHGGSQQPSRFQSAELMHGLHSKVSIMNTGERKGAARTSPRSHALPRFDRSAHQSPEVRRMGYLGSGCLSYLGSSINRSSGGAPRRTSWRHRRIRRPRGAFARPSWSCSARTNHDMANFAKPPCDEARILVLLQIVRAETRRRACSVGARQHPRRLFE